MATESGPARGYAAGAERTQDEVVIRLPSLNRLLRSLLPEDALKHIYAAQREQLLAVRALVDAAIRRLEAAEQDPASLGPRRTEIRVE